jgi:hypothetical protein
MRRQGARHGARFKGCQCQSVRRPWIRRPPRPASRAAAYCTPAHLSSCWCTSLGSVQVWHAHARSSWCTGWQQWQSASSKSCATERVCNMPELTNRVLFVGRSRGHMEQSIRSAPRTFVATVCHNSPPTRVCERTIVFCFSCTSVRQERAAHAPRSAASCVETNLPLLEKTSERVGAWLKSIS